MGKLNNGSGSIPAGLRKIGLEDSAQKSGWLFTAYLDKSISARKELWNEGEMFSVFRIIDFIIFVQT